MCIVEKLYYKVSVRGTENPIFMRYLTSTRVRGGLLVHSLSKN